MQAKKALHNCGRLPLLTEHIPRKEPFALRSNVLQSLPSQKDDTVASMAAAEILQLFCDCIYTAGSSVC